MPAKVSYQLHVLGILLLCNHVTTILCVVHLDQMCTHLRDAHTLLVTCVYVPAMGVFGSEVCVTVICLINMYVI